MILEQSIIATDHQAAEVAAREAGALTSFSADKLTLLRYKEHGSWMFLNEGLDGPDMAIKVEPNLDEQLLPNKIASVALIRELREGGAPLEAHLIDPQRIGNYVVSATSYLPGKYDKTSDYRGLGAALTRLHTTPIESMLDRLPPFNPLVSPKESLRNLYILRDNDALPRYGDTVFDDSLIKRLEELVARGDAAAEELVYLAENKGYAPSILHNDVTPANALIDKNGETVFVDMDHYTVGPWAYDLARPLGQWWRFRRPSSMARGLAEGYRDTAPWGLDPQLIKLGIEVAKARYAPTAVRRVTKAALRGDPQNEYLMTEAVRRMSGEPYWRSEEEQANQTL